MVKKIYLLFAVILLTSCYTTLNDLTMKKTPYLGDKLRIDGYYYSDIWYDRYIRIVVFYRDGFCFHTWIKPVDKDTLKQIENDILLNEAYINRMKNEPNLMGVFQIMYPDIQFENWEYRTDPTTFFGTILNDTTFFINKWVNNRTKEMKSENLTYRFKQFSPKPDSTNVWIK